MSHEISTRSSPDPFYIGHTADGHNPRLPPFLQVHITRNTVTSYSTPTPEVGAGMSRCYSQGHSDIQLAPHIEELTAGRPPPGIVVHSKEQALQDLPPGLSQRDADIVRKLRRRVRRLESSFLVCNVRFGWTSVIGRAQFIILSKNMASFLHSRADTYCWGCGQCHIKFCAHQGG